MEIADTSTPVSGVTPAAEAEGDDTSALVSGVTPAAEGDVVVTSAQETGPASGVIPAADPKATIAERSPWETLTGEVSPWETLTGDVPELEEGGRWTEYFGRRGKGGKIWRPVPPARRTRVEETDANIMVESLDRDSTIAAIRVSPVVPQLVERESAGIQKANDTIIRNQHVHAWMNSRLCSVTPSNMTWHYKKTHEHGYMNIYLEFNKLDVWFCPNDPRGGLLNGLLPQKGC